MATTYVETWQPDGIEAEASKTVDTFESAIEWLQGRKLADDKRILRVRGTFTPEQVQRLSRFGTVEHI